MTETLLLVDDEDGIRKVLGITLADMGYQVLTAENGQQALEIFHKVQPSIVLTDIKMPGMDGLELLQRIKSENPETEVVMITGHGDMELAIRSLKYEATDFVTKPINDDVLEIALKRARERMAMRRALRQYTENLEEQVREKSARLVRAERLAAVGQVVESLAGAFKGIVADLQSDLTFFNDLPCFVAVHNRDLKIVATNELFTRRLGDRTGKNSWELYTQCSADRQRCPVNLTFETGQGQRTRETIQNTAGVDVPVIVHTAPIRNQEGEVELVLEISVDITEIKRLQEDLWTTQAKYQRLFDEVPCYISVLDRDYRVTAANRAFKEDFDSRPGARCFEIFQNRTGPCPDCPAVMTWADGQSHQTEMVATARNGDRYNVLVTTAALADANGAPRQVMELSTNITQIRVLQDHLSSLGLLIGSISHGIKGLLTGLDGGMYLIGSGFAKDNLTQVREGWEVVQLMVGRIRRMVLDILYYAKERDLNWERIDVLSLAAEVALIVEPKAKAAGIGFVREFDPALGHFEVDPGVVRSALVNILENAIEACLEDPTKPSHRVIFGVRQEPFQVIFEVVDDGMGMDKATKDKLFTLFFSSKGPRGTGLGLFLSNKIIDQHGGRILIDSDLGRGTRFRIALPKSQADADRERAANAEG